MPTLDDVVCPSCITACELHDGWASCPRCGYQMNDGAPTVRQMLTSRGPRTGANWNDVNLARWSRWLAKAIREAGGEG